MFLSIEARDSMKDKSWHNDKPRSFSAILRLLSCMRKNFNDLILQTIVNNRHRRSRNNIHQRFLWIVTMVQLVWSFGPPKLIIHFRANDLKVVGMMIILNQQRKHR